MSKINDNTSQPLKSEPRSVLRDRVADLVERFAASLDDAEILRLTGRTRERADFAALVAGAEELLLLAELQRKGGFMVLTKRICAMGG